MPSQQDVWGSVTLRLSVEVHDRDAIDAIDREPQCVACEYQSILVHNDTRPRVISAKGRVAVHASRLVSRSSSF